MYSSTHWVTTDSYLSPGLNGSDIELFYPESGPGAAVYRLVNEWGRKLKKKKKKKKKVWSENSGSRAAANDDGRVCQLGIFLPHENISLAERIFPGLLRRLVTNGSGLFVKLSSLITDKIQSAVATLSLISPSAMALPAPRLTASPHCFLRDSGERKFNRKLERANSFSHLSVGNYMPINKKNY